MILLCCAVKEEAAFFKAPPGVRVLITGMGARNAEQAIRLALREPFKHVITAGFAGALNPDLKLGEILAEDLPVTGRARAGRFHFVERIVVTAREKRMLWNETGADAVEMESKVIRAVCLEKRIACGTLRVISDTADEDLPVDFNKLMTANQRLSYPRLTFELLKKPALVKELKGFERKVRFAAKELGKALEERVRAL